MKHQSGYLMESDEEAVRRRVLDAARDHAPYVRKTVVAATSVFPVDDHVSEVVRNPSVAATRIMACVVSGKPAVSSV